MQLEELGYSDFFREHAENISDDTFTVGRVITEQRGSYTVKTEVYEIPAELTGKLQYSALSREELPAVGDWVVLTLLDNNTKAIIHDTLPRKTCLVRKAVGKGTHAQIIAANIDLVFIIQGLDHDFNLRRLERYIVVSKESGAQPVILLSKSDLCDEAELADKLLEVGKVVGDVPVHHYSAVSETGMDSVKKYLSEGVTICFVGSSGAGKSTLINTLTGNDMLATSDVRENDSRGRHTTTHKQMVFLDGLGILIDTPGLREIALWWDDPSGVDSTFPDIAVLTESCHFSDCTHVNEPDCNVLKSLEDGTLDQKRYDSYIKLMNEVRLITEKKKRSLEKSRKSKGKKLSKLIRGLKKTNHYKSRH